MNQQNYNQQYFESESVLSVEIMLAIIDLRLRFTYTNSYTQVRYIAHWNKGIERAVNESYLIFESKTEKVEASEPALYS